jgi:hypothetical protein
MPGTIVRIASALLVAATATATPSAADSLIRSPVIGSSPGLPVVRDPLLLDGTGRLPNCNAQGVCNPGGYGSSGKAGVRDYYRDLRPDMRGQARWRPRGSYRMEESGYRQPDAYIDLDLAQPGYRTPSVTAPRRIDGNPSISGPAVPGSHVDWCLNRYRSYRASDDTFQPYQGPRRRCDSPFG